MKMKPLSKDEINKALGELAGWGFEGDQLKKSFKFDDFRSAVGFIVRISFEAEELNHHPELKNVYNQVDISLNTHDAGGKVTQLDVDLAKRIDRL
ncbi:MAG: 4a-hydroxytetrahydrobiopterin dehydratase [Rhodothermales bacterium]